MTVPAAYRWVTNGRLIEAVATLGYLRDDDWVVDVTFGLGTWWTHWVPWDKFTVHDLYTWDGVDFRNLPEASGTVDVVALDGPYKLSGTPTKAVDGRYGVDRYMRPDDRHALIKDGMVEAYRVLKPGGRLLLKCQDQVSNNKIYFQTDIFTRHAEALGLVKIDELMKLGARAQPMNGRKQRHAHGRPSSLLVFMKRKVRRGKEHGQQAAPGRRPAVGAVA